MEQLRDVVADILDRKGVLTKLKAELKAQVLLEIERHTKGYDTVEAPSAKHAYLKTEEGLLLLTLVHQFLGWCGYDSTLQVFNVEASAAGQLLGAAQIKSALGLTDTAADEPLLLQVVRSSQSAPERSAIFTEPTPSSSRINPNALFTASDPVLDAASPSTAPYSSYIAPSVPLGRRLAPVTASQLVDRHEVSAAQPSSSNQTTASAPMRATGDRWDDEPGMVHHHRTEEDDSDAHAQPGFSYKYGQLGRQSGRSGDAGMNLQQRKQHSAVYDAEVNLSSSLDLGEDDIAVEIEEYLDVAGSDEMLLTKQHSQRNLQHLSSMEMQEAGLSTSDRSGQLDAITSQMWSVGRPDFVEGVDDQQD